MHHDESSGGTASSPATKSFPFKRIWPTTILRAPALASGRPQPQSTGAPLLPMRTMFDLETTGDHLVVNPVLPEAGWHDLLEIPDRWRRIDVLRPGPL